MLQSAWEYYPDALRPFFRFTQRIVAFPSFILFSNGIRERASSSGSLAPAAPLYFLPFLKKSSRHFTRGVASVRHLQVNVQISFYVRLYWCFSLATE